MRPNMGWYDANPVHLAELTPSDYAQKLVEYFGDTDAVLEKAKEDFAKGEYQWVAQITNSRRRMGAVFLHTSVSW